MLILIATDTELCKISRRVIYGFLFSFKSIAYQYRGHSLRLDFIPAEDVQIIIDLQPQLNPNFMLLNEAVVK